MPMPDDRNKKVDGINYNFMKNLGKVDKAA